MRPRFEAVQGFLFKNFILMVYTFYEDSGKLEVYIDGEEVVVEVDGHAGSNTVYLEKDSLYDLIGALHSIQGKLKGVKNG